MLKAQFRRFISLLLCLTMLMPTFTAFAEEPTISNGGNEDSEWREVSGSECGGISGRTYRVKFTKQKTETYKSSSPPSSPYATYTVTPAVTEPIYGTKPKAVYKTVSKWEKISSGYYKDVTKSVPMDEDYISGYKTVTVKKPRIERVYENRPVKKEITPPTTKRERYTIKKGYYKTVSKVENFVMKLERVWVPAVYGYRTVTVPGEYFFTMERVLVKTIHHPGEYKEEPIYSTRTVYKEIDGKEWVAAQYGYVDHREVDYYTVEEDRTKVVGTRTIREAVYDVTVTYPWVKHNSTRVLIKTAQELKDEGYISRLSSTSGESALKSLLDDASSAGASSSVISSINSAYQQAINARIAREREELKSRLRSEVQTSDLTKIREIIMIAKRNSLSSIESDAKSRLVQLILSEIPNASESRLSTLAAIASSEGLGSVSSAIQTRLNEIEEEKKRIALEATLREEFRLSLSKMTLEAILKLKTDNLNHKYIDLINNELASLNAAFDEIHNMINTSNSIKELYSLKVTARRYEQLQVLIDGRIKSLSLNGGIVKHDDIYNPTNEDLGKVPIYAISEIGQVTEIAPESDGQYLATEGINKFYRKYMFTTSSGLSHLRTEKSPIDLIKNLLNIVGFVPVIGEVADALSGTISLIEGKYFDAVLSGISLLATVGNVIAVPLRNIAYFFSAAVQSSETALDLINTVKRLLKVDDAVKLATFMRNAFDGFSLKVYKKLEEAKAVILGVLKGIVDKTMFTNLSTYLGRELNGIHNSLHKLELEISQFYNKINDVENIAKGTGNLTSKLDNIVDGTGALNQGVVDDVVDDIVDMANAGELTDEVAVEALDALESKNLAELDDEILEIKEAAETLMDGDQYTKVNRLKTLKGDISYQTPAGHLYKTDSLGRIDSAEGTLELATAKRNSYAQRVSGRTDRLADDHGGHLIASIFNGSGDLDNLVPMNGNLNQGEWKAMENVWAKALGEGKEVKVSIDVLYEGSSLRPTEFYIDYYIDGVKFEEVFENVAGGGL